MRHQCTGFIAYRGHVQADFLHFCKRRRCTWGSRNFIVLLPLILFARKPQTVWALFLNSQLSLPLVCLPIDPWVGRLNPGPALLPEKQGQHLLLLLDSVAVRRLLFVCCAHARAKQTLALHVFNQLWLGSGSLPNQGSMPVCRRVLKQFMNNAPGSFLELGLSTARRSCAGFKSPSLSCLDLDSWGWVFRIISAVWFLSFVSEILFFCCCFPARHKLRVMGLFSLEIILACLGGPRKKSPRFARFLPSSFSLNPSTQFQPARVC